MSATASAVRAGPLRGCYCVAWSVIIHDHAVRVLAWGGPIQAADVVWCSRRPASHTLITDWRVTPSRRASRSRAATIQAGKTDIDSSLNLPRPLRLRHVEHRGHVLTMVESSDDCPHIP